MQQFKILFKNWLTGIGINESFTGVFYIVASILIIATISIISNWIAKKIILQIITRIIKKTKATWDDVFLERKVFNKLSQLAPALVIYFLIAQAFPESSTWIYIIQRSTYIYMIIVTLLSIDSFVNALHEIYNRRPRAKEHPIKNYVQVVQIILYFVVFIFITAIIFDKSPAKLFTGLGAMAAVLMLVFRDTILGLVAGIQLSLNNMMNIGDWITMSSHNADGVVIEISLTTVKVQNFDKTITTIPTYALVSQSFNNWQGLVESEGRRIKRSLNIDIQSISFCSEEFLDELEKVQVISAYIKEQRKEIVKYNKSKGVEKSTMANGRRLTNIGVFRKYVEAYLHNHPRINLDMTFLVRQLQPTEKGVPIEIYVFSNEKRWIEYENIQSDIFDHLLAAIKIFNLSIYQAPSGNDLKYLIKK